MNRRGVSETNYSDDEDPNPHERLTRAATTGIMEGISYLNPHEQLNRVSSSGSNISPPKRKTCIVKLDGCKYTIGSTISYIQIKKLLRSSLLTILTLTLLLTQLNLL